MQFDGVEGYHFKHDAFGNIISALEAIDLGHFMPEHGAEITDGFRTDGAVGSWGVNASTAAESLTHMGIQAIHFYSSIGIDGWILAKSISVSEVEATSS